MLKVVEGGQSSSVPEDIPDECLIMAYVDNELNEAGRLHVESLLRSSAEAREIAALMKMSCSLVRSAFSDALNEKPCLP
jgi:anti-sigma factor RsiW